MGCCFSNKSNDDDDKEQIVTRVRTHSRIPPMKKNTSYGTLSEEDDISLHESHTNQQGDKEIETKASETATDSVWSNGKSKQPKSTTRKYQKFTGRKKTKTNEPQNPFETSKKTKLKRAYATKVDKNKAPATKYAQGSPVFGRIEKAKLQNMNTNNASPNKAFTQEPSANDVSSEQNYTQDTMDKEPLISSESYKSVTFDMESSPKTLASSDVNDLNIPNMHQVHGNNAISETFIQQGLQESETKEDNLFNEKVSSIEKSNSVSDIPLEISQKEGALKPKGKSKKNVAKKVTSKLGKMISGKNKKKEVKK